LGWNPKTTQEFFSMEELIEKFDLKNVHKAWAVFDIERLNFFNAHYLKNSDINELYEKFINYLEEYDKEFLEKIKKFGDDYNKKILNELKTKIKKFDEYKEQTKFLYDDNLEIKTDLLINEKMKITNLEIAKKWLEISLEILENRENNKNFESIEEMKNIFIEKIKKAWLKNGQVLWPTRVALSSEKFSPWALELIFILGIEKSIKRIKKYLEKID
jgi:glutamyl/glutaminyl-tRNA synthetase